tara:strand:+ start:566 stop:1438 length:873 start_codon:yes stop_codon:yes gene_type:complete
MKVAIIGYGFVGKALKDGLKGDLDIALIDPKLNTDIKDLINFLPDIIFISVPTPMNDDGTQDIKILESIVNELEKINTSTLIVLKSTVLPNYLSEIKIKIPNIVYNPEFLRENFAKDDFINSNLIIFGGNKKDTEALGHFYKNHTNCINTNYQFTDLISASLIKYSINTFLSTKVVFFNELHKIFNNSGSTGNWKDFVEIMMKDDRVGNSHMQVPGPDGKLGFGGPCFPKDTNALLQYSKQVDSHFSLLEKTISINNQIRSQYKSLSARELEQNISFKDNSKNLNKGDAE